MGFGFGLGNFHNMDSSSQCSCHPSQVLMHDHFRICPDNVHALPRSSVHHTMPSIGAPSEGIDFEFGDLSGYAFNLHTHGMSRAASPADSVRRRSVSPTVTQLSPSRPGSRSPKLSASRNPAQSGLPPIANWPKPIPSVRQVLRGAGMSSLQADRKAKEYGGVMKRGMSLFSTPFTSNASSSETFEPGFAIQGAVQRHVKVTTGAYVQSRPSNKIPLETLAKWTLSNCGVVPLTKERQHQIEQRELLRALRQRQQARPRRGASTPSGRATATPA